ncbi:MAG: TonB-dependent receptor [Flavobacteriaceae bacterium]|nr:TonB-dependent receptor [Flavobacteriaceae bacterium]
MRKSLLYVGTLLTTLFVNAQPKQDTAKVEQLDEVVITDSRFKLKRENSGKTVIKITSEEIQRSQGRTVAEVINSQSGIEINGTRSNGGQNLSSFIRGGNNRQVLIIIDGVQVTDPSTLTNSFDLRLLDLDQIDTIEIIKGAASALYGNNAATAVINITMKEASDESVSASFSTSVSTNQSATKTDYDLADFKNNLSVNGTFKKFTYQALFGHQHTDGLSAVSAGSEKDVFSSTNAGIHLGYQFSKNFSIKGVAYQDRFTADYDNTFPTFADADFTSLSDQYRFGLTPKFNYTNGSIKANMSYHRIERKFQSNFPSQFSSKSWVLDIFNKYNFDDHLYAIAGLNSIDNTVQFNEEKNVTSIDPYLNMVWVSDFGLNLNIGARLNNHSEYGSHFIYNLNPSYTITFNDSYLKLLGSYSTSFIAPNLSQLFGDFGPNPNLDPEENTTFETGAELKLSDKLRVSALYFNRKEVNFIDFVIIDFDTFEGEYQNIKNDFSVQGAEIELNAKINDELKLSANYTFTEKKDVVAFRLPKHKANASLNYAFTDTNFIGINYQFVGERKDNDFSQFPSEITLDSFSLIDFNFRHELLKNRLFLSASITNILNEDYTEIFGFSTRGRNLRLGLRLNF